MAIIIREITGTWTNWRGPELGSAVTDPTTQTVRREHILTWGTPTAKNPAKSGYGFRGGFPPVKAVARDERFILGRFRHFNHLAEGQSIAKVDLVLNFSLLRDDTVYEHTITFRHDETRNRTGDPVADADIVTFDSGFPDTVELSDGVRIRIIGFASEPKPYEDDLIIEEFASPERSENTAYLVAELVSDGPDPEECTTTNAVFNPDRCEVPCILPIVDIPILEDCDVPDAPAAIWDCPDIDLPIIGPSEGGFGDGPPGPPGESPVITVSSSYKCVDHYSQVRVETYVFKPNPTSAPNWTHIHFVFYIVCDEGGGGDIGKCCWWVWCPCPEGPVGSDPVVDLNCPKTGSTCTYPDGYWVLYSGGPDCTTPPCSVGEEYGDVRIRCKCADVSDSLRPCEITCCPDLPLDEVTAVVSGYHTNEYCTLRGRDKLVCTAWADLPQGVKDTYSIECGEAVSAFYGFIDISGGDTGVVAQLEVAYFCNSCLDPADAIVYRKVAPDGTTANCTGADWQIMAANSPKDCEESPPRTVFHLLFDVRCCGAFTGIEPELVFLTIILD